MLNLLALHYISTRTCIRIASLVDNAPSNRKITYFNSPMYTDCKSSVECHDCHAYGFQLAHVHGLQEGPDVLADCIGRHFNSRMYTDCKLFVALYAILPKAISTRACTRIASGTSPSYSRVYGAFQLAHVHGLQARSVPTKIAMPLISTRACTRIARLPLHKYVYPC